MGGERRAEKRAKKAWRSFATRSKREKGERRRRRTTQSSSASEPLLGPFLLDSIPQCDRALSMLCLGASRRAIYFKNRAHATAVSLFRGSAFSSLTRLCLSLDFALSRAALGLSLALLPSLSRSHVFLFLSTTTFPPQPNLRRRLGTVHQARLPARHLLFPLRVRAQLFCRQPLPQRLGGRGL